MTKAPLASWLVAALAMTAPMTSHARDLFIARVELSDAPVGKLRFEANGRPLMVVHRDGQVEARACPTGALRPIGHVPAAVPIKAPRPQGAMVMGAHFVITETGIKGMVFDPTVAPVDMERINRLAVRFANGDYSGFTKFCIGG